MEVSATRFIRNFAQMKENVREHGMIAVSSHRQTAGAFISPAVMEELQLLRRHRRELTRIEEADDAFFGGLDRSVASYDNPE